MKTFPVTFLASGSTLKNSLVACWELNETTGTTMYDSHNSYNGTIQTYTTINQTGKLDKAYSFDTTSTPVGVYGTGDSNFASCYNDPFTITAWVKKTTVAGGNQYIFCVRDDVPVPMTYLYMDFTANTLNFGITGANYQGYTCTASSLTFTTDTWYHLAARYDGSADHNNMKLHRDTSSIRTGSSGANPTDVTPASFIIGRDGGSSGPWRGLIDQVAFWKRELTDGEISQLYNSGSGLAYSAW